MTYETEQKLFSYLAQEFNITPLQSDMQEIEHIICEDHDKHIKDVAVAFADWYCNGVSNRDRKQANEMYADFLRTQLPG